MNITYTLVIFREVVEIILFLNIANLNLNHISNIKQLNYISLILAIFMATICLYLFNSFIDFGYEIDEKINLAILTIGFLCILYNANAKFNSKKHLINLKTKETMPIILILFSIIFRELLEIMIFSYGLFLAKINFYELIISFMVGTMSAIFLGQIMQRSILILTKTHKKLLFEFTKLAMLFIAGSFLIKIINISIPLITNIDIINSFWFEAIEQSASKNINYFNFQTNQLDLIVYFLAFSLFVILFFIEKYRKIPNSN